MKLRFSLRHVLIGMAVLCVVLALAASIHRSSIVRSQEEQKLALELSTSIDSVDFLPNGRVGRIDQVFALFEGDGAVAPMGHCRVLFCGLRNSFDFKVLNRFSALTWLELYQCELSDDQWDDISRNPTIETVFLTVGTTISDHGRKALQRANIKLIE